MLNRDEFGWAEANREQRRPAACASWAVLLPDAAEGLLSEAERRALDGHLAACQSCTAELADAQRGAAWMGLLKSQSLELPPDLLGNILARTVGTDALAAEAVPGVLQPAVGVLPAPAYARIAYENAGSWRAKMGRWLGLGQGFTPALLQPRLTMTAAMAFFSVCLTLNLLGISVRNLQAQSLRPLGLHRAVADRSASLVRSFEGIRTVYRVESRVNEWLSASSGQNQQPLGWNR